MTENRYSRKRIDRIIDEGQVREKISLFLRDRMGYYGKGFILNYSDIDRLSLSVSRIYDREEWVKQTGLGLRIENGFKDMNLSLERVRGKYQTLLRTLSELVVIEKFEEDLNRILSPQRFGEDEEGRPLSDTTPTSQEIRQAVSELTKNPLMRPSLDSWGNIDLGTQVEGGLRSRASEEQNDLRSETRFFLCYEDSMRRKLGEFGLPVPEYEEYLTELRGSLDSLLTGFPVRFRGEQDLREENIRGRVLLREPEKYPFPSLRDMIENYSVRPEDIDLNDEESRSLRNDILTRI